MGDRQEKQVICPECGNCPTNPSFNGSAHTAPYCKKIRRRAWWLWIVIFALAVVASLPWVHTGFGPFGTIGSVFDWQPNIFHPFNAQPLAKPPVRWRDLKRAADGDIPSINQFRESFTRVALSETNLPKKYISYTFAVGSPGVVPYNPKTAEWYFTEFEGKRYPYTLGGSEWSAVGWPGSWVQYTKTSRYALAGDHFHQDHLLNVDDDLIHISFTTRFTYWKNTFFPLIVIGFIAWGIYKICLWRGGVRKWARVAGLGVAVLMAIVVLVIGLNRRTTQSWNILSGDFTSELPATQRSWERLDLEKIFDSDEQTRALAQTLIDDFGEMTHPDDLVISAKTSRAGFAFHEINFGFLWFEFFRVGRSGYLLANPDGTTTPIAYPYETEQLNRHFSFWNGAMDVSWMVGDDHKVSRGITILYQDITLWIFTMWVFLKVFRLITRGWFWRVRRRRLGRGVCVWCGYPCGGVGTGKGLPRRARRGMERSGNGKMGSSLGETKP